MPEQTATHCGVSENKQTSEKKNPVEVQVQMYKCA